MSAARLPYYQQLPEDEQRRRSTSRGRSGAGQRTNGAYHERNSTRRNYSRSRSRSRSVERRRYSRSRSRSTERQRRRNSRHQQHHRHHKDSNDSRSWDADRRERDRDYSRRHQRDSRSRSATPPPSSSGSRRQQQQPHGGKQGRIGGSVEDNVDDMRIPLPTNATSKDKAMSAVGAYYNLDTDEPFDKERIHREIEEKLRMTLAREGKIYPPPKQEASHPVFANDGSFMELFKKMQEEQQRPQQLMMMEHPHSDAALIAATAAAAAATAALRDQQQQHLDNTATVSGFGALPAIAAGAASSPAAPYIAAAAAGKSAPPPPMVGRRRGGKILKTGVVAKLKAPNERDVDPKDFWSLYLAEVNKYKSNACDTDNGKRPLVK